MAAPIGNDFWKRRSRHGPDELFETPEQWEELRQELYKWMAWVDANPRYKVEQQTGKGKPHYDDLTGELVMPDALIHIPIKRPYTLQGFSLWIGVGESFLRGKRNNPATAKGLKSVLDEIFAVVKSDQVEGGLTGEYNANLAARLNGISETTKSEISGPEGAPLMPSNPLDNLSYEQLYKLLHGKPPETETPDAELL